CVEPPAKLLQSSVRVTMKRVDIGLNGRKHPVSVDLLFDFVRHVRQTWINVFTVLDADHDVRLCTGINPVSAIRAVDEWPHKGKATAVIPSRFEQVEDCGMVF